MASPRTPFGEFAHAMGCSSAAISGADRLYLEGLTGEMAWAWEIFDQATHGWGGLKAQLAEAEAMADAECEDCPALEARIAELEAKCKTPPT